MMKYKKNKYIKLINTKNIYYKYSNYEIQKIEHKINKNYTKKIFVKKELYLKAFYYNKYKLLNGQVSCFDNMNLTKTLNNINDIKYIQKYPKYTVVIDIENLKNMNRHKNSINCINMYRKGIKNNLKLNILKLRFRNLELNSKKKCLFDYRIIKINKSFLLKVFGRDILYIRFNSKSYNLKYQNIRQLEKENSLKHIVRWRNLDLLKKSKKYPLKRIILNMYEKKDIMLLQKNNNILQRYAKSKKYISLSNTKQLIKNQNTKFNYICNRIFFKNNSRKIYLDIKERNIYYYNKYKYLGNRYISCNKIKVNNKYLFKDYKNIIANKRSYNIFIGNLFEYLNNKKLNTHYVKNIFYDMKIINNTIKSVKNSYDNIYKNTEHCKYIDINYIDIRKTMWGKKYLTKRGLYIYYIKHRNMLKKDVKTHILKNNISKYYMKKYKFNLDKRKYSTIFIKKHQINIKYIINKNILLDKKLNTKLFKDNINGHIYITKYNHNFRKTVIKFKYIISQEKYIFKPKIRKALNKYNTPIYLNRTKYRYLQRGYIPIYKIRTISKYMDITRKWWILEHDDLTDILIIPNIDYPYENTPVADINKHPISSYKNINYSDINYGTKEIEISIKIMQQMLNFLFVIWNCGLINWYNSNSNDAVVKVMDIFYYWLNIDSVKEEMIEKNSREDYLRIYRWFRWEAEKVWFKVKDEEYDTRRNGVKSVGIFVANIIEYMKNHHYDMVPITSSYNLTIMGNFLITFTWRLPDYFRPINKIKGKRKYYLETKMINQIKKKLIYKE